jgi:pimeloyl-ACP methyl ester carboxylesterase
MSSKSTVLLLLSLGLLLATGCATLSPQNGRYAAADRVAAAANLQKSYIKTASFTLTAYAKYTSEGEPLHIYIEGDGAAWHSRTWLSDDPTPKTPLVLELAGEDPAANVAYLARPGQYAASGIPGCNKAYWSEKRFAGPVVPAINKAIDVLREQARAKEIHLIGYSGGAAISVLIAAQRNDVISLRTVAGNLDPEAINRYHHVSPLKDSPNPMDAAEKLRKLPQRHFVGARDLVVPLRIAQSFLKRQGRRDESGITVVENAGHARGWREHWKTLLAVPLTPQ